MQRDQKVACQQGQCEPNPGRRLRNAKKIRKTEVLTKPVMAPHHASCSDPENCIEQARKHRKTTRAFLKRLARGGFETYAFP